MNDQKFEKNHLSFDSISRHNLKFRIKDLNDILQVSSIISHFLVFFQSCENFTSSSSDKNPPLFRKLNPGLWLASHLDTDTPLLRSADSSLARFSQRCWRRAFSFNTRWWLARSCVMSPSSIWLLSASVVLLLRNAVEGNQTSDIRAVDTQ